MIPMRERERELSKGADFRDTSAQKYIPSKPKRDGSINSGFSVSFVDESLEKSFRECHAEPRFFFLQFLYDFFIRHVSAKYLLMFSLSLVGFGMGHLILRFDVFDKFNTAAGGLFGSIVDGKKSSNVVTLPLYFFVGFFFLVLLFSCSQKCHSYMVFEVRSVTFALNG
jgi:hypothetical protein